ncbi:MAG: helix-turn-helix domain-containing protein [Lachnospiraceae bacterium]|nr:helix-turn-helix domain-containing protein [Lachnospiraceae bacterium]
MARENARGESSLLLLESCIPRGEKCYIWYYSAGGEEISSSCPEEERKTLGMSFRILGGLDKALSCVRNSAAPRMIGSPAGMQWAVTRGTGRDRDLICVIGPVFYSRPEKQQLRRAVDPFIHSGESMQWAEQLAAMLPELPVIAYAVFIRYVIMIHNTLTGEHLGVSDILHQPASREGIGEGSGISTRDRGQIYRAEQALLDMVRRGEINYQRVLQGSASLSGGVPIKGKDPLRQMKTSIVVFTTLVSRAAMEGGLSPETAYALGDSYIQAAEDCTDSGELTALSLSMYHDFIYRVHYVRSNPNYSHEIQKCCDFIELSLDRKIRTSELASLVGYTDYYLTEKFRKETGMSVAGYIREKKVQRAKVLLESTKLEVREIAEELAFNTPNYFIQSFREITGMSPAQYRKSRRKEQEV